MQDVNLPPKLLLVEDSYALIDVYKHAFEKLDISWDIAETFEDAQAKIKEQLPDVLLLDLHLPDGNGMELLEQVRQHGKHTRTIVITSNGSINTAIAAMRAGATNFLVKPFSVEKLRSVVAEVLENELEDLFEKEAPKELVAPRLIASVLPSASDGKPNRAIKKNAAANECIPGIVGNSTEIRRVSHAIKVAAPTEANVLITGKTGTGKELCAEAIHNLSNRSSNQLVVLNCAAIPKDLMESELFGHLKGSFTGATSTREGAAHLANGGSLFLDEIGEMDIALQSKLLRFVQNQTFQRVGSNKTEKVSVRFIAATNRNPVQEIEAGRFREDLYYRLNVVPIHLPSLSDRQNDVIHIAQSFLEKYADPDGLDFEFTPEVIDKFLNYQWPGNIRQLQNVIRNALIFATNKEIGLEDISSELMPSIEGEDSFVGQPLQIAAFGTDAKQGNIDLNGLEIEPMHMVEQKMIQLALDKFNGNVAKVASALEISASSVYRKKL